MSDENDGIFVCTECKSDQRINPYKNIWVQQEGITPPCKLCGGVVVYVEDSSMRDSILESSDKERGLGR